MVLFFCQAEGKTQPASASRTGPALLENQGRFYMWGSRSPGYRMRIKVVKVSHSSFSLHYFKTVIVGIRPRGNWGPAVW